MYNVYTHNKKLILQFNLESLYIEFSNGNIQIILEIWKQIKLSLPVKKEVDGALKGTVKY